MNKFTGLNILQVMALTAAFGSAIGRVPTTTVRHRQSRDGISPARQRAPTADNVWGKKSRAEILADFERAEHNAAVDKRKQEKRERKRK